MTAYSAIKSVGANKDSVMTKPIGVQADTNRREFLTGAAGFTLLLTVAPDTFMGGAQC